MDIQILYVCHVLDFPDVVYFVFSEVEILNADKIFQFFYICQIIFPEIKTMHFTLPCNSSQNR